MNTATHMLQRRAQAIAATRNFFDSMGFMEVDTPVLIAAPAPETHIDAVPVALGVGGVGAAPRRVTRYLQTSPELPMKRMLAAGCERIYQIAPVFRDGEVGPHHRPEFRLLEWYRRDAPWTDLMHDCEGLLRTTALAVHGNLRLEVRGQPIDLERPFRRVSVDEAFVRHAGFSILDALEPSTLRQRLHDRGLATQADDTWDDLFHRIFVARVEPALTRDPHPLFLTDYPAPLAALARLSTEDPRTAERFELYVGGVELANGYGELCDPSEQRRRFDQANTQRVANGLAAYPLDTSFLTDLSHLDAAAGIALGVERWLMVLFEIDHIAGVHPGRWVETQP